MKQYLIRLDDACPNMNQDKWQRMEKILSDYSICPMVGVIPNNADDSLSVNNADPAFWCKVERWKIKGWTIALHGFDHCYVSTEGGLNPMWRRSEFAGVPLDVQKEKIRRGIYILEQHNIKPQYFFAPSHTFDENTLIALKECSDIRIISDTVAMYPYRYKDFTFIPQFGGRCMNIPFDGIYTFCFHPNTMTELDFLRLEKFIRRHKSKFCGFDQLNLQHLGNKRLFDKIFSYLYFLQRKIRNIK